MIKLNCGAGSVILPSEEGWLNLDCRALDGIDIVVDMENNNLPFIDCGVDEVRLQDFLEHLSQLRQEPFLRDVYRVLKPGGKVFVQLPDIEVLAKRYCGTLKNSTDIQRPINAHEFAQYIFGGEDYPENKHKWGYDRFTLRKLLERIGFVVERASSDGGSNLLCSAVKE